MEAILSTHMNRVYPRTVIQYYEKHLKQQLNIPEWSCSISTQDRSVKCQLACDLYTSQEVEEPNH